MEWQTAMSAFLEGYQRGEALKQQKRMAEQDRQMRAQQMAGQLEDRQFARDDRRAARDAEAQQRAATFVGSLPKIFANVEDPNQLPGVIAVAEQAAQMSGVPTGIVQRFVPRVSDLTAKAARKYIEGLAKVHDLNDVAQAGATHHIFPNDQGYTFDEVWGASGLVMGQDGKPVLPKKGDKRGFQVKEARVNGKNVFANFDPDTGKFYDPSSGQELTGVEPVPPPMPKGPDPSISAFRQFSMSEKLANTWTKANAPYQEMSRQLSIMKTGMRDYDSDPNGASQAVLVTFQKILDPTSVVRESEYARTLDGQAFFARLQGFEERLRKGGAGMPKAELAAMVSTAERMLGSVKNWNNGVRARITRSARQYEIDPALVFDDEMMGATNGDATISAPTGVKILSITKLPQ